MPLTNIQNIAKGLGKPELRTADATATLTAAEFHWLKEHRSECPAHLQAEFDALLRWEKRSAAAKTSVRTKRAKYKQWPCNRKQ